MRLDPASAEIHFNLALALAALGKRSALSWGLYPQISRDGRYVAALQQLARDRF